MSFQLPSPHLLRLQAEWLSDARARILRVAEIARRKRVLDLGAGYGIITEELRRRTSGMVVALDYSREALRSIPNFSVCADATQVPFQSASFDFVFSQNVLLWIPNPERVVDQISRVLTSDGVWVLFEPDYGGMIEHPFDSSAIWRNALIRAGADPMVGRRLPSLLEEVGFQTRVELLPRLMKASAERFDFLEELSLTEEERLKIETYRKVSSPQQISHLPYFLIIAERPLNC